MIPAADAGWKTAIPQHLQSRNILANILILQAINIASPKEKKRYFRRTAS